MTSGTIRVTSVCMRSVVGDIEGNLRSMLSHIRGSRTLGSDLVLFPELSLTGYSMPSSADHPLPIDSTYIGSIVDAAADHDVIVCFGYVDDKGHISQVVTEKGRISGIYHKTHLGRRESEVMTPGDSLDVIHTSKTGLGIQLCWESHFPDITRTYAMRGAEVILMPHASPLSGYRRGSVWSRILPARCNDNTVFAVACNASGDNGRGTVLGVNSALCENNFF